MSQTITDFNVTTIDGSSQSMSQYKDKVLLIVNVASQCGFTYQYEGLENLYKKYKDRGFVVLGFPCNQFGAQEPGDENEIKNFCKMKYDVSFPLFKKIDVNGPNTEPLFMFLKNEKKAFFVVNGIAWNFTKFLVDRNGKVVGRYQPTAKPESLADKIESLL
ncbi:MAG: glutathione peroxidase [Xanthomonadaceae bacterium]|nr:glutathione peroxidase [Xanthomonadaceae bacterium]